MFCRAELCHQLAAGATLLHHRPLRAKLLGAGGRAGLERPRPARHPCCCRSPLHPALVAGDVLGVQQLVGGGILAQAVLRGGAGIHEGLSHNREAGIRDAAFVDIKHELGVFDYVHPESEREAVGKSRNKTKC